MAAASTPSEENLERRLLRLDAQIRVEYDLIGHRVSWLLVSNSFLLGAFALALDTAPAAGSLNARLIEILVWCLPLIGAFSSLVVFIAVLAAHGVVNDLKTKRALVEDQAFQAYGFERLNVDERTWHHLSGNLPPLFLPWVLAAVWGLALWQLIDG
jgi:hypothetical protein